MLVKITPGICRQQHTYKYIDLNMLNESVIKQHKQDYHFGIAIPQDMTADSTCLLAKKQAQLKIKLISKYSYEKFEFTHHMLLPPARTAAQTQIDFLIDSLLFTFYLMKCKLRGTDDELGLASPRVLANFNMAVKLQMNV